MHTRDTGFTLLETLVALAILAVALTAAFRAMGVSAQSAGELRERLIGDWVAENRLAELRADSDGQISTAKISTHSTIACHGFTTRSMSTKSFTPSRGIAPSRSST